MTNQQPLVSVIVPTKNSTATLEACLHSIRAQTYAAIELIVVDNFSTDGTQELARKYADKVFEQGPERSTQRNFGVEQATGGWVAIIDSDMVLSEKVIEACVAVAAQNVEIGAVVIPEESFGEGFWAQCKKLERGFYVGVSWMEAARFFKKTIYQQTGGYNADLVSGEDWDLSQRIQRLVKVSRIDAFIFHNEGRLSLLKTLKKKYYYAQHFAKYMKEAHTMEQSKQTGVVGRYRLFFSNPKKLFELPLLGLGMLFMKTCEFLVGGVGMVISGQNVGHDNRVVLLVSHFTENKGTTDFFRDYLMEKKISHFYLRHPFSFTEITSSQLLYFDGISDSVILEQKKVRSAIGDMFRSFFLSCYVSFTLRKRIKTVFGFGSFNVLPFLFLRNIQKRKVVFWGVDYSVKRFDNWPLDAVYALIESLACRYSNQVYNSSSAQEAQRINRHGLVQSRSQIVPNGIHKNNLYLDFSGYDSVQLIYIGSLSYQHGILDFIKRFYIEKGCKIKLHIFGGGEAGADLRTVITDAGLNHLVQLHGYRSVSYIIGFLQNQHARMYGVAPYIDTASDHVVFGDSLKIKEYINYNIPFITSDVVMVPSTLKSAGLIYRDLSELDLLMEHESFPPIRFIKDELIREYYWGKLFSNIQL